MVNTSKADRLHGVALHRFRCHKMYSRTDCSRWDPIQMNKMNNKSKATNQSLKQIRREVNNLRKRVTNNAPVSISTRSGNQGRDYYHTKGMERISDVSAISTAYAVTGVFLNAANPSLFPWLSGIAKKYDLYRFKKLIFRYKPSLPTSESGNVYLGIDYNTLDPAPPTSTDFCQLSHWNTNVVWKPQSLQAKCPSTDWFYTRSGSVPNSDYKTYDIGKFFVAVENISYVNTVGYIEVDYEVEFARRQPDYVSSQPLSSDMIYYVIQTKTDTIPGTGARVTFDSNNILFDNSDGMITLGNSDTEVTLSKTGSFEIVYSNAYDQAANLTISSYLTPVAISARSDRTIPLKNSTSLTVYATNASLANATTSLPGYLIIRQIA